MKKKVFLLSLFMCFFVISNCYAGNILTIEKYMKQVEENNPEIISTNLAIEAINNKILEMDMVYAPYLSAGVTYMDDRSGPSFGSTLIANEMKITSVNAGLNKKFKTGTTMAVGYADSTVNLDLLSPISFGGFTLPLNFTGYEIKPFARFEQSLLKDFNSNYTKSGINKARASAKAGQYMLIFKKQQLLLKARSCYYNLSLFREITEFRNISLSRANTLLAWTAKRVNLDLTDKSDLNQMQAFYKLKQLNLQMSQEEEVKASRSFNESRNKQSDKVEEKLTKISEIASVTINSEIPSLMGKRADVLSAMAQHESSRFANTEAKYRSGNELSLYGIASMHGLDLTYSNALGQIGQAQHPTYTIGLNFIAPLNFSTLSKVRDGYRIDMQSAEETLKKTELSCRKDWDELTATFANVKSRITLAMEIRDIQKQKVADEKTKLERGRSTLFQLLSAENDLDDAELNIYRMIFEQLIAYAQLDLYNTKNME